MNSITTNREFFSEFFVKQTRAGGLWEAVAPLPDGQGLPPRCRAAWGAGRPAVATQRATRSRPPSSGAAGVYSCKFRKQKYIFVKNEIEKYKNRKTAYFCIQGCKPVGLAIQNPARPLLLCLLGGVDRAGGFQS